MPRAVVLLSGGLDSATCLAIAKSQGFELLALTVDYGQRHHLELEAASAVANFVGVARHEVIKLNLRQFGASALTDAVAVPKNRHHISGEHHIPVTYVPARNTVFLSLALAFAEATDSHDIFIGVSAVDYSGYPDCRPEFIEQFQKLADVATRDGIEGRGFRIHTPLIRLSKEETIRMGIGLGLDYGLTHSCYDPIGGKPCGQCDSCLLRAKGFAEAGVPDPLVVRT